MTQTWKPGCCRLRLLSFLTVVGVVATANSNYASAQIVPDNTLGGNRSTTRTVNSNGLSFDVIGGGVTKGTNLFHSFSQFSVLTGHGAYFNNDIAIQNIISRVTGSSVSNIDGLIAARGKANLFLINPNGIIFGPNASLLIGGSFLASTANSLTFADGSVFSATTPQASPLLTISVPIGLQYGNNPASVQVQGSRLQVPAGQTLALIGGNVQLDGASLLTLGSRVELGGLAATGVVGVDASNNGLSLSFPEGVVRGDVSLINGAEVNVRAGGGGSIAINAQNLNLAGGSKLRAGIASGMGAVGSQGGDIDINATGAVTLTDDSFIANVVQTNAVGNAGDINITTGNFSVTSGAYLNTSTNGQGNGGNVNIRAVDKVSFDGASPINGSSGVFSNVDTNGVGKGGDINITTGSLAVTNGAQISAATFGKGDAGSIIINARDQVVFDGEGPDGSSSAAFSQVAQGAMGKSGGVNITTGSLLVTNGAQLVANTLGQGDAGSVIIHARDQVTFDGEGSDGYSSRAASDVRETGVGKAGDINITTGSLAVTNGAVLLASTRGQGDGGNISIQANGPVSLKAAGVASNVETGAVGNGGNINIQAESLELSNGTQIQASVIKASPTKPSGRGNAGNIDIDVQGSASLSGQGTFIVSKVDSGAEGNGGNIDIKAGSLSLTNGAQLSTSTSGRGDAGNISIQANNISLVGNQTAIFSSVESGAVGNGGNINISADSLQLSNGAQLDVGLRQAFQTSPGGQGNAGNVNINVRETVALTGQGTTIYDSVGSGAQGNGGNINIRAGALSFTNGASLFTATLGQGNAGNVNIDVSGSVTFAGMGSNGTSGDIFTSIGEGAVGNGGNINIQAGSLSLADRGFLGTSNLGGRGDSGDIDIKVGSLSLTTRAFLNTATGGQGNAGSISVGATDSVTLTNGAFITTSTSGQGNAGNVTITARNAVSLDGVGSTGNSSAVLSTVESGAVGKGGNINITAGSLSLTNGAELSATSLGRGDAGSTIINTTSSTGNGAAGNIQVQANYIGLNNQGLISADTVAGQGNINLRSQYLVLRHGSGISTNASGSQVSGGDITLNNDFLIALQNSDITANSQDFRGGNVNVTAQGIFGTAFRPHLTPQSDITATGANSSLNGTVVITTPSVDPSHGITTLPAQVADASKQIARGCAAGDGTTGSQFAVTGRGGLPPSPNEVLSGDAIWQDTRLSRITAQRQPSQTKKTASPPPVAIVPATGWVFNGKGEVTLIGQTDNASQSNLGSNHVSCSGR